MIIHRTIRSQSMMKEILHQNRPLVIQEVLRKPTYLKKARRQQSCHNHNLMPLEVVFFSKIARRIGTSMVKRAMIFDIIIM